MRLNSNCGTDLGRLIAKVTDKGNIVVSTLEQLIIVTITLIIKVL